MLSTIRRLGVVFVFAILSIAGFSSSSAIAAEQGAQKAVQPSDSATAELTALLHYFLANSATEAAHAKIWSDDLVYTSSNGSRYGKADIMGNFADEDEPEEATEESEGPQTVYTGEDVNIQVFGTTAVVTFRLVGTPDDGSETSQYFNSGTFVKQHGSWQAVMWQATIIPSGT